MLRLPGPLYISIAQLHSILKNHNINIPRSDVIEVLHCTLANNGGPSQLNF
jgi:hypothetical protein